MKIDIKDETIKKIKKLQKDACNDDDTGEFIDSVLNEFIEKNETEQDTPDEDDEKVKERLKSLGYMH